MQIKKAVITAAARGSRLYPVADTVQKAMLPVIDVDGINKPLIQIIADEAFASGIEEVCIVCAPGDDTRYVSSFKLLQSELSTNFKGNSHFEKQSIEINNFLDRITFAIQKEPLGYGHAVYSAADFIKNDSFLLMHGDYLYVSNCSEKRCAGQLIDLAVEEDCSVAAVNPTIEYLVSKYGTVTGKTVFNMQGVYSIEKIIEKPSISIAELELHTPGLRAGYYLCFFGMHVLKPPFFSLLKEYVDSNQSKNIQLTPVLQKLTETDKYLALEIKGGRYDTSREFGLTQAQIALALAGVKRDEIQTMIINLLAQPK